MSAGALAESGTPSTNMVQDVAAVYLAERGKPMPGFDHAKTQSRLVRQLARSSEHEVLSELNLELGGWRCVPDISVYPAAATAAFHGQIWVAVPPTLAVEIFSPSQTLEEMTTKVDKLLNAGVPSVWLVIPSVQVITIYQKGSHLMSATSGILTDPVTGISVNVDEVFA
jgi:Uma2 family endonuclease